VARAEPVPDAVRRADPVRTARARPAPAKLTPRSLQEQSEQQEQPRPPSVAPSKSRAQAPAPEPVRAPLPKAAGMLMQGARAAGPRLNLAMAPPVPPSASGRIGYSVQVYSVQYAGRYNRDAVEGLRKRFERSLSSWKGKGYAPYLYKTEAPDANLAIAICIGAFASPKDAAVLAEKIRWLEQTVALVVPVELYADGRPVPIDAQWQLSVRTPALAVPELDFSQSLTVTSTR
jgi:hypothetical protein